MRTRVHSLLAILATRSRGSVSMGAVVPAHFSLSWGKVTRNAQRQSTRGGYMGAS